jgi:hypothetical protein
MKRSLAGEKERRALAGFHSSDVGGGVSAESPGICVVHLAGFLPFPTSASVSSSTCFL